MSATMALLDSWGVTLNLKPVNAQIDCGCGEERARSITFTAKFPWRDSLRTPDNKDLGKLDWEVTIHNSGKVPDGLVSQGAIGTATYSPELEDDFHGSDEQFFLWVSVPSETFDSLQSQLLSGRKVSAFRVTLLTLDYDFHPDGSGKIWDIAAKASAPVKGLTWSMPMYGDDEDMESDPEPISTQATPATAGDIASLAKAVVRVEAAVSKVFQGVIALACIAAAALLLK